MSLRTKFKEKFAKSKRSKSKMALPLFTCETYFCKKPVYCAGGYGRDPGSFRGPKSIAIDHFSGNIYVADSINNRIQVFSPTLIYLFLFYMNVNDPNIRIASKYPWGLCIVDQLVYVTEESSDSFSVFTMDGAFVSRCLAAQFPKPLLKRPKGITFDGNRLLICASDRINSRIIALDFDFPTLFELITFVILDSIIDVKVFESKIFVLLSNSKYCLKIFSLSGIFLRNLLPSLSDSVMKISSDFFAIDFQSGNILLSNTEWKQITVISADGDVYSQVSSAYSMANLRGIAIDTDGTIVSISERFCDRLKVFK